MQDSLQKLVRKNVEVIAHGGITYKGQLIEAGEEALFIKTDSGWVTIPMDHIISVRGQDEEKKEEWRDKDIDPSFFRFK